MRADHAVRKHGLARLHGVRHSQISRFAAPPPDARQAAVLVVLREVADALHTVLVVRAPTLRAHAGQVAFPGGSVEPGDVDPAATALREAVEETTLDPGTLTVIGQWPQLWIPVSGFAVTPVFAWCDDAADINGRSAQDEIVSAHSIALADMSDPGARRMARYPNGATGPAFEAGGLFIWGFTGLVLDRMLHVCGWEQPWHPAPLVDLPGRTPSPPESLGPRPEAGER